MEQSCHDVILGYQKYGFLPEYFTCLKNKHKYYIVKEHHGKLNKIKLFLDDVIRIMPKTILTKKIVSLFGLNCYILVNRK